MEALERRGRLIAIAAIVFIVFWSQCTGVSGHRNSTKMHYVCPPDFVRLGHSCYYFSENMATWQRALFACKDRDSHLSVPARWEDRNLRNHLNRPDVERTSRWIGGVYDYAARAWKWGGELRSMHYQSFSKMRKMAPEELQFHCIAMEPELLYRWAPRSCIEPRKYICQTKLRKVSKAKLKHYQRKWQSMGQINEITAPSASNENDPRANDVTPNPLRPKHQLSGPRTKSSRTFARNNLKSYDLRPNELRKRSRPPVTQRRLTRPFRGYKWNRKDPEASYRYNAELLRSGRTGLSAQQINTHLARLQHLRDKQVARRKRLRTSEWLENKTPTTLSRPLARTYTLDNHISALHPKQIVEEFDMPPPIPVALVRQKPGTG